MWAWISVSPSLASSSEVSRGCCESRRHVGNPLPQGQPRTEAWYVKVPFTVSDGAEDQGSQGDRWVGVLGENKSHKPWQAQGQDWEALKVGGVGKTDSLRVGPLDSMWSKWGPGAGICSESRRKLVLAVGEPRSPAHLRLFQKWHAKCLLCELSQLKSQNNSAYLDAIMISIL